MVKTIVILTTCASIEEAERIAVALLDQRLIACATIGAPVTSRYRWEGQVQTSVEVPLTLKSQCECFDRIAAVIQKLHSYDVPEIVALPVEAVSAPYRAWLEANTICTSLG